MLGISNAGKTSYVAAMYGELSRSRGPFSVMAQRPADHQWLSRNATRLLAGNYPAPSDRRATYALTLHYDGSPMLDFIWRDYRGGALTELSDESTQASQLRTDLASADGVVILIDSTELVDRARARARLRPVIAAAVRVLTELDKVTPVVIALTKWDLVAGRERDVEAVAAEVLGDFVAAVHASDAVYGCLLEVACGRQSINVALPVLWCIHVGVTAHFGQVVREAELSDRRALAAYQQKGMLRDFGKWLNGTPTSSQEQLFHRVEAAKLRAYLAPFVEPAERLGTYFENVFTF